MSKKLRERWSDKLQIREGDFTHTFRLFNPSGISYGDTLINHRTCYVNLIPHESISNIIDTCIHESLHCCMKREDLEDDIEHELIRRLMWMTSGMY